MRKLVTLKPITAIEDIPNADAIELLTIADGWRVVAKRGEFTVGEDVLYHEIDSFLPVSNPAYKFLAERSAPREFDGTLGVRLRSIKLRGALSQGLVVGVSVMPEVVSAINKAIVRGNDPHDIDFSYMLNVKKYERPLPAQLAGNAKGNFPSFLCKTDQERCQNLYKEIFIDHINDDYEITIKMDGSSFTGYYNNDAIGVCSRNLELKLLDNDDNAFVRQFNESGLAGALSEYKRNIAVQGELCGTGIQGNPEKLLGQELFVFDIWDIDKQQYMLQAERWFVLEDLRKLGFVGYHVPVVSPCSKLPCDNMADLLAYAEGKSYRADIREGLVYKSLTSDFSFKTISNKFLLRGGE